MDVAQISVPHTGTIFTVNLFIALGFDNLALNNPPVGRDCLYYGHCMKPSQIRFALEWVSKGTPLVVPLRHPYLVEEAWKRRAKVTTDMFRGFRNLMEHFVPLDPYFMPVDSECKVDCLEKMRKGLGLDFKTDWKPKHSYNGTYALNRNDLNPSKEVQELAEEMEPLLERFYETAR